MHSAHRGQGQAPDCRPCLPIGLGRLKVDRLYPARIHRWSFGRIALVTPNRLMVRLALAELEESDPRAPGGESDSRTSDPSAVITLDPQPVGGEEDAPSGGVL